MSKNPYKAARRKFDINPVQKCHSISGYNRQKFKKENIEYDEKDIVFEKTKILEDEEQ